MATKFTQGAKKGKSKKPMSKSAIKPAVKKAAKKSKVVAKKAKPAAKPSKVTKVIRKAAPAKIKKSIKPITKKVIAKKKPVPKKAKVKTIKKPMVKKMIAKKVVAKKAPSKAKPILKKPVEKKPVAKKIVVSKPIKLVKTVKPMSKPIPQKIAKPAVLAKAVAPAKPVKPIRPVRKGPPVVVPSMNHKTIAEKIEQRKAAPMKMVLAPLNISVVGPVPSISPYRVSPGEEYMNEKQEKHFLEVLQAWKRQLMEDVDKTVSHLKEDAENYADINDRATQEEEFNLELRTRDRERKLLKKIDETIRLIENGDFGYCEACGVEIGLPRLEVRPTATQCIDCKTFEEIREKQLTL